MVSFLSLAFRIPTKTLTLSQISLKLTNFHLRYHCNRNLRKKSKGKFTVILLCENEWEKRSLAQGNPKQSPSSEFSISLVCTLNIPLNYKFGDGVCIFRLIQKPISIMAKYQSQIHDHSTIKLPQWKLCLIHGNRKTSKCVEIGCTQNHKTQ